MTQNDTYGEITREELADLRLHAQKCLTCGMLATVDPAFHAQRYGHAPRVNHGGGIIFRWDTARHAWIQESREHEGEIDHAQCPPGSHTFDAGDDHYEGRVDEHGNQRCNDCAAAMFYCTVDNQYHHVQGPGDEVKPCFLIPEQAWPVPAPQPGEHIYEPDAADRSKWTCIRHQGQPCPPLDTAVLTRATAYPAPPEPETCFCGGKVRYGRCRECDTLYGQREEDS